MYVWITPREVRELGENPGCLLHTCFRTIHAYTPGERPIKPSLRIAAGLGRHNPGDKHGLEQPLKTPVVSRPLIASVAYWFVRY